MTSGEGPAAPVRGLVWAFAFDGAGAARGLADDEVRARVPAHEGWLWLHFNLADARARDWIAREAPLSAAARDLLLADDPRHRVHAEQGEVAAIVSDFHLEFGRDRTFEVGRLRVAMTERMIVSARHHPLQTIERVRDGLAGGRCVPKSALCLELIVDAFLDASFETLDAFSDDLDAIEEAIIAGSGGPDRRRVGEIRRALLRLHREIVALRFILRRLHAMDEAGHAPALAATVAGSASHLLARLDGLDHEIRNHQERSRLIREEVSAGDAAAMNRHLYVLSVLSAVFLPGTLITGVFGMNTKDLALQQTDDGFWYALGFVAVATLLVFVVLRARRPTS